ncbi:hypothetical protein PFISCL1PPCAC_2555 [Pristionchus fissidentatus]|uniref:Uncharacterized protein n=1 Tax=Pristionchus fissidentatus TaxID=1538716 RepID=A0AAV5UYG0_9BILA|nr:hypothetical protein PFISCL1PPCAC_2555 [Pristionchus fissidentatus]
MDYGNDIVTIGLTVARNGQCGKTDYDTKYSRQYKREIDYRIPVSGWGQSIDIGGRSSDERRLDVLEGEDDLLFVRRCRIDGYGREEALMGSTRVHLGFDRESGVFRKRTTALADYRSVKVVGTVDVTGWISGHHRQSNARVRILHCHDNLAWFMIVEYEIIVESHCILSNGERRTDTTHLVEVERRTEHLTHVPCRTIVVVHRQISTGAHKEQQIVARLRIFVERPVGVISESDGRGYGSLGPVFDHQLIQVVHRMKYLDGCISGVSIQFVALLDQKCDRIGRSTMDLPVSLTASIPSSMNMMLSMVLLHLEFLLIHFDFSISNSIRHSSNRLSHLHRVRLVAFNGVISEYTIVFSSLLVMEPH